jgi:hypothetical protein
MLSFSELEAFYHGLVAEARERGVACAITSGMACVAFGVAETTQDCDLLCAPAVADKLLRLLSEIRLRGYGPGYRGHLSAPLDARWLGGGWTSHFAWGVPGVEAYLDVFGVAPRGTTPWEAELQGFYAGLHTVAEMKRTNRERDWPFATALGIKLLESGDTRGWLHIFNHEALVQIADRLACPPEMLALRPVLRLLVAGDERLEVALRGEVEFWHQLDAVRIKIYERVLRPYLLAVKSDPRSCSLDLHAQHAVRLAHAERLLPTRPLAEYGLARLIADAQERAARLVPLGALEWLPDVRPCFSLVAK